MNLDGWTSMGRTNDVFALTPAPLQVHKSISTTGLGMNLSNAGAIHGVSWNAWSLIHSIFGS